MSQSATHYVDVSVTLEGSGPQPAGFGVPMFMHQHALESARLAGPFSTAQEVLDEGHASGSPPHVFAQALLSQQPRARQFYIGRADAGDADVGDSLDAIVAENPGAWYCALQESRDDADNLAFAQAIEALAFPKIGLVQSSAASLLAGEGPTYEVVSVTAAPPPADGVHRITLTGFGLAAPVNVDVTVAAGVPATDTALMAAFDAAFDTAAAPAGDLEGVVVPDSISNDTGTLTFRIVDGLASGTVTTTPQVGTTLTATMTDGDIGSRLFDLNIVRCALLYYHDDAVNAVAAWASRCLAFNLDQQKGVWAYKRLNNVTGSTLTNAQVAALRNVNANYFAPAVMSSGVPVQSFTAQGWMPGGDAGAGRRIDVTTTLDWAAARLQEGLFDVLLRETHGVPFSDAGLNRFAAAVRRHFSTGIAAGHYLPLQVPEGEDYEGENTPAIFVPRVSDLTAAQRASRAIDITSIAYLQNYVERVNFSLEIKQ